jgi:Ca2+/Na+ antiporter
MKLFSIAVLAILLLLFVLYIYKYFRHKHPAVQVITLESFLNAHLDNQQENIPTKSFMEQVNEFFHDSEASDTGDSDDGGDDGGE